MPLGVGISYCACSGDVVLCLQWGYRIVPLEVGISYCAWARVIVLCLQYNPCIVLGIAIVSFLA